MAQNTITRNICVKQATYSKESKASDSGMRLRRQEVSDFLALVVIYAGVVCGYCECKTVSLGVCECVYD